MPIQVEGFTLRHSSNNLFLIIKKKFTKNALTTLIYIIQTNTKNKVKQIHPIKFTRNLKTSEICHIKGTILEHVEK